MSQLETLQGARNWVPVVRPAVVGDGIRRFDGEEAAMLRRLHDEAAAAGRVSCFVPASGVGSRLFQSLFELYQSDVRDIEIVRGRASQGDKAAQDALRVLDNLGDLAIWSDLQRRCPGHSVEEILGALFGDGAMRYDQWPKGLIPFHGYEDGVRTAFAEHIVDAIRLSTDRTNRCRVHFTVGSSHQSRFEREWLDEQPQIERHYGVRIAIGFSVQSPASDTVAMSKSGEVIRDRAGNVMFRPGGHGALLQNLGESGADLVFIRNIDNVARQERSVEIARVRKQMCGLLLLVEGRIHDAIRRLRGGATVDEALQHLGEQFDPAPPASLPEDARRAQAIARLNRPIRVCGMVPTSDQPGGAPFWARGESDRDSLQIVESAEIDLSDAARRAIVGQATHFNPVDMVCSLRDVDRQPFDLTTHADPDRVIVTEKSIEGVPALVYEHPGLWNGGMARWTTVFVEIPADAFNPVKTLSDLLNAGHRPPDARG